MLVMLFCGKVEVSAQKQSPTREEVEARANQGDFEAMYALGRAHFRGVAGFTKDEDKGRYWYRAAYEKAREEADKGNKQAVRMVLNFLYKDYGGVVGRDTIDFMIWFQKAIDMNFLEAQLRQAHADMVAKRYTQAVAMLKKIEANPDNKENWYAGYMGECYYYGLGGLQRNYAQAVKYFKLQVDGGRHTEAYNNACSGLGLCYYYGRGIQKNVQKAVQLWEKEKHGLNPEATYLYGLCLIKGTGTAKNVDAGLEIMNDLERRYNTPEEYKQKARTMIEEVEGERARQRFLADQRRRQEEERRQAEYERQNTFFQGVYTATGKVFNYIDGSMADTGVSCLYNVKVCRNRIYIEGTAYDLTSTNGDWLGYGSYEDHPIYLYNTKTGEIRYRTVLVFFGKFVSDNIWVKGDHVAENTSVPSSSGYSDRSTSPTPRQERLCSLCGGRGWIAGNSTPEYGVAKQRWCRECGMAVSYSHSHDRCPSCRGHKYR